jgi:hypothetical protein
MTPSITLHDLLTSPRWVAWRNETRHGTFTKVPYSTVDRRAEPNDSAAWRTHDDAAAVADVIMNGTGGGTGIMLGRHDDTWLGGVDLDTCRDPRTETIEVWAQEVLDRLATYAEVSPSGTGVKAFFCIAASDIAALRDIMGTEHGRQFRKPGGGKHACAIELYISNRYFTVTWEYLPASEAELRQVSLDDMIWLVKAAGPALSGRPNGASKEATASDDSIMERLEELAKRNQAVASAIVGATTMRGGSRSEGALAIGAALIRADWSLEDMTAALLACPATKEWATEAKRKQGQRQFRRIEAAASASAPTCPLQKRDDRTRNDDSVSGSWPSPLDFFTDVDSASPELRPEHVPAALWGFVKDHSERLGVDPTSIALGCSVACAAVISDDWCIQPKRHDTTWTENARLWGAIVGDSGILKSPIIAACTRPIERLDAEARERHQQEMQDHKAALAAWKASEDQDSTPEPRAPKLARYLVEGSTIEALSEVLRDDAEARQYAPTGKVLSRHDEMSEFFSNLDRYKPGGKGGGDRGAYLRLYNGGRWTIDRIGRGSFAVPNWSACFLGGIQPGPIQKIAKETHDDGLLQRFMYSVPGPQQVGLDRTPDSNAIKRYEALFPRLVGMHPPRLTGDAGSNAVILHDQAHQHRDDIDALARALAALPDTSPRLRASLGKWPGLFARLCLTFHLIDFADASPAGAPVPHVDVVSEETARRAAGFMQDIVLPHLMRAEAVMFATVQTSHAQWIAGYILAQRLDRITSRDVVRAYWALRSPEAKDELAAVMASLTTVGWLEPEIPSNPVKPVWAWRVNPSVHVAFEVRAKRERELRAKAHAAIAADFEVLRQKRRDVKA